MAELMIFPDSQTRIEKALGQFVEIAQKSIHKRNLFSVSLSGGSTPAPLYRALAAPENRDKLKWSHIHLFWGDERHVPPEHADSNFRMVKENLLDAIPIPDENVHRVPAEMPLPAAALKYEGELRAFFKGEWPRFDLVLLGMGEDGHTASLFPHSSGLDEEQRWFIANFAPKRGEWRLTLTKKAINAARNIMVLVEGRSKADMLGKVLTGPLNPKDKPVQLIKPVDGRMIWLLDREAASQLPDDIG